MNDDHVETVGAHLERCRVSRRRFLEVCSGLMVAAPFGLSLTAGMTAEAVAEEVEKAPLPHVIWLHFQDCTGCSESLLRLSTPDFADLILSLISLDYHETVMAASGHQAERALKLSMEENFNKYVLVVEGSIPRRNKGIYMKIAGRPAIEILDEVADRAAAVIAIGSCASWGGIPSAAPNPTDAAGVDAFVKDKPVINVPGCPPNPYVFLATVLQFVSTGKPPDLDEKKRPKFAYDRVIHEHCPRRAHYDAGRFAKSFGDYGHRHGWCLYKLGCKGPMTHAPCSVRHFNDIPDVWPIGCGIPCVGCTEEEVAFKIPIFEKATIFDAKPPALYPPVEGTAGDIDPLATGLAGLGVGVIAGGTFVASQKFSRSPGDPALPGGMAVEQDHVDRTWEGPEPDEPLHEREEEDDEEASS